MRILIVYMSHTGTVRECVSLMKRELGRHEVDECDLSERVLLPDPYDIVIIGSYIHKGRIPGPVAQYMNSFGDRLCKTGLGIFLCCGYLDLADRYISDNIPETLRKHAFDVVPLGGRLDPSFAKSFMDKLIIRYMRMVINRTEDHLEGEFRRVMPAILPEQIGLFVQKMTACLQKSAESKPKT